MDLCGESEKWFKEVSSASVGGKVISVIGTNNGGAGHGRGEERASALLTPKQPVLPSTKACPCQG